MIDRSDNKVIDRSGFADVLPGEGAMASCHHRPKILRMPMLDTNNVSGGLALILYKYAPGIFSNTTLIRLIIIHKDRDMIITHSGYKTGIAILLAAMTALTLTGCAKHTAPAKTIRRIKRSMIFSPTLVTQRRLRREKKNYIT